jgi:methionyl-tRNA synthetase
MGAYRGITQLLGRAPIRALRAGTADEAAGYVDQLTGWAKHGRWVSLRGIDYRAALEAIEVRKAAQELRAIWVAGNEYLQAAAPWSAHKTDPAAAAVAVRLGLNLIALYAGLSEPFIPDAAAAMSRAMAAPLAWPEDPAAALRRLPAGHAFTTPEVLFRKIADEERENWQQRFSGIRA